MTTKTTTKANILLIRGLTIISIISALFFLSSCLDDDISTNPDLSLRFSQDTLVFDTVFTTKGSATRSFRIINTQTEVLEISRIYLDKESESMFRLNVDGLSGNDQENIRVPAMDSIWVFAEVTIDPDMPLSISPFVIEDKVKLEVNGNEEEILLQAFGQNANYITDEEIQGRIVGFNCSNGEWTWDDPKPYVIFGVVVIDSCFINWVPNTRIHIHGGIARTENGIRGDGFVVFGPAARLSSVGSFEQPVIIEGDRLEPSFDDIAGQYGGLIFTPGSQGNILEHTIIKNSTIAVRIDSTASVSLSYCEISNSAAAGISSTHADLSVENSLIYGSGQNAINIDYGGTCTIKHSTLSSYGNNAPALLARNFIERDLLNGIFDFNPLNLACSNTIIAGNSADELQLGRAEQAEFNLGLNNCILKVEELIEPDAPFSDLFTSICPSCINMSNTDPLFRARNQANFNLDTLSIADNTGLFNPDLPIDLNQVLRVDGDTDIGCYQFVPEM